jgi:coenzyme PQQ precursor peptide PqqA
VQPSAAAHGPPARFASSALKETPMTWETPTAIDMRFGFEITMYVTAR